MTLKLTIDTNGVGHLDMTPETPKDGEILGELDADLAAGLPQAQLFANLVKFATAIGELPAV